MAQTTRLPLNNSVEPLIFANELKNQVFEFQPKPTLVMIHNRNFSLRTGMHADFHDAHKRHFEDAEFLHSDNRLANADQLYGVSAECGLKALMLKLGMPFDRYKDRPTNYDDRTHINKLWDRFEVYRSGHVSGAKLAGILPMTNPFLSWDISNRYAKTTDITQAMVDNHKTAATQVKQLVKHAQQEGLL
ncbi:hypothetical protein O1D11_003214 [Vibrio cholerae]|nr:hypothetical protein [Vibrio cholerae]